jgi:peptidoglycan/LPS O-acetylase OafA/YrhL
VTFVLVAPERAITSSEAHNQGHRLDALDGFRALAISWVVLYHYCFFWTPAGEGRPLVAYGNAFAELPFVSVGYLGVHLFFVISGFVILLTLERTRSLKEFLIRRAVRLWPALLLCGTVTFAFMHLLGPHELQVGRWEYALSLIAVPPQHVALLVGAHDWTWLDGAYWSLWVEAKFYCIIGFCYFVFPRRALAAWMAYELFTIAVGVASFASGDSKLQMLDGFLFQPYVPYFSFGLAAYAVWSGQKGLSVRLLTALSIAHIVLVSAMHLVSTPEPIAVRTGEFFVGQAAIFLLVYLFAWVKLPLRTLQWSPLVHFGRASYGVYLLHQNIGITILSAPLFAGTLPGLLGIVLVIATVTAIAVAAYEFFELPLQAWLKARLLADKACPEAHLITERSPDYVVSPR